VDGTSKGDEAGMRHTHRGVGVCFSNGRQTVRHLHLTMQ
jgi:hypothetical protein